MSTFFNLLGEWNILLGVKNHKLVKCTLRKFDKIILKIIIGSSALIIHVKAFFSTIQTNQEKVYEKLN